MKLITACLGLKFALNAVSLASQGIFQTSLATSLRLLLFLVAVFSLGGGKISTEEQCSCTFS